MDSLAEILQAVIASVAAKDWDKVENRAEDLKVWVRAAREAAGSHANEHPGNGDGKPAGR